MVPISWIWVFTALALIALVLSPLVFWRGQRFAYLAVLWAALAVVLGVSWYWNFRKVAYGTLQFTKKGASAAEVYGLTFYSGKGRVSVGAGCLRLSDPSLAKHTGTAGPSGRAGIDASLGFSEGWHGFDLVVTNLPGSGFEASGGLVIFPAWFGTCLFLSVPLSWLIRRPGRRRRSRSRNDLCLKCGYDLRTQNPGEKCPECGTAKPELPRNAQLSTAAETQGKQL